MTDAAVAGHDRRQGVAGDGADLVRREEAALAAATVEHPDLDPIHEVMPDLDEEPAAGSARPRRGLSLIVRVLGIAVAIAAVVLCVMALVDAWPSVSQAIANADLWWLAAGLVASGLGMAGLALLWQQVLLAFDRSRPLRRVIGWYFAGELGKYIPGGIWPVVGRGELARRAGMPRSIAYATTLLSLVLMCVGAAVAAVAMVPFIVTAGSGESAWLWLLLLVIPAGVACAHPKVCGAFFGVLARLSKGRVVLVAPTWGRMIGLIGTSVPTWLAVGGASAAITAALGYEQNPAQVAFAAIVAWIVGFLAVPVPAGAGIRELVFVALCGLAAGPAVAVAAIARITLMVVDGVGGVAGLLAVRNDRADRADPNAGDDLAGRPDLAGSTS